MEKNNAYDLIVIGGGMSGVSASVAAARRGARTLLVEQTGMLGGMGTGGLITMMMTSRRWFYGFGRKTIERMISRGDARRIKEPAVKGYDYYPYDAEAMKRELERAALESGVELLYYSKLTGLDKRGRAITAARLAMAEGDMTIAGRLFIDATGDGRLAALAGEEVRIGDERGDVQAPTMIAYYAGIDFDKYERFLQTFEDGKRAAKINMIHALMPRAVREGVISEADLHHPGIFRISERDNVGMMNAGHVYGADCATSRGLTDATIRGRRMAYEYLNFYRIYVPGFENAYMTNTGSVLALRETGRVVGAYVTTFKDKTDYLKFPDAIMRFDGGAVTDLHASNASPEAYGEYQRLFADREAVRQDDFATLPYKSLLGLKTDNLLLAGRCVSADRKVLGQIRIMGYCFMMGEAAGLAAWLACENNRNAWDVPVLALQNELRKNGVETV